MTTATGINEKAAEEFFRRAIDAEKAGNSEKAMEFYERALGENPDHESAAFSLAILYDRRGDDGKAIELYERICTGEPVHINALMNLAVLYEDNNMYSEARRCLLAVLISQPANERAKLYLKDVESADTGVSESSANVDRGVSFESPIMEFDLSVRSRNCLKKMNVRTLGDLLRVSEAELLSYKNFGDQSLREIKDLLTSRGLHLGMLADPATAPRRPMVVAGDIPSEILEKNLIDLELSVRSRKALQRLNIQTVGELASRTEDELLGCKNFGQTSLNELKQLLQGFNLNFRKLEG